jgi:hypothetical protein
VPLHTAAHQVHRLDEAVGAAPVDVQLAVALHGAQAPSQGLLVTLPGQTEERRQLGVKQRPVGVAQRP